MKIEISGNPIAWMRPALGQRGMKAWLYDEQKKVKEGIRWVMKSQWNVCFDNPNSRIAEEARRVASARSLTVSLTFLFKINQSDTEALKNAKRWGMVKHNEVPDWDNLAKFYMDCGNGILWSDDKIVNRGVVRKDYSKNPRTIIEIMAKENLNKDSKVRKILEIFSPERLQELAKEVKKFDYLSQAAIANNSGEGKGMDKEQWQLRTSMLLAQFAENFSHELSQVNKYKSYPFNALPFPLG